MPLLPCEQYQACADPWGWRLLPAGCSRSRLAPGPAAPSCCQPWGGGEAARPHGECALTVWACRLHGRCGCAERGKCACTQRACRVSCMRPCCSCSGTRRVVCGVRSVHACGTVCAVSWQSALQPEMRGECVQCELTMGAASCAMSVCHAHSLWEV